MNKSHYHWGIASLYQGEMPHTVEKAWKKERKKKKESLSMKTLAHPKYPSSEYKMQNLTGQTHHTWRSARALHTRFDCAGVRFGGERTGYIETISWKIKIKISNSSKWRATKNHLSIEKTN